MKRAFPLLAAAILCSAARAQEPKVVDQILSLVETNYVDPVDGPALRTALRQEGLPGVFKKLDPYCQYLPPDQYKELNTTASGSFGGVGMMLQETGGGIEVTGTIPGSPAHRAGVMPGERLAGVDGTPAAGLKLADLVKKIRGEPGTSVRVLLAAEEGSPPREVKLLRETVRFASPRGRMVGSDAAYLQIPQIGATTAEDAKTALEGLKARGMRRLVLDLRDNGGGLLSAVVDLGSLFLDAGKLLTYTQGRAASSRRDLNTSRVGGFADLPLILLVNGGTAAGAEILAGALQDYERARLVGSRTFGKGGIQSLYPLADGGALKLTIARYHTPKGRMVDRGAGFLPDVPVEASADKERASREYLESLLRSGTSLSKIEADREPPLGRALELLNPGSAPAPAPARTASPPAEPQAAASEVDSPSYRMPARARDFALVIGVSKYSKLPEAPFAERDAEAVKKHLAALGIPPRNIISLSGPDATRGAIQGYVEEWLPKNVKPESTVFVYYSGHGAPDPGTGAAYLVPWDGDASFLQSTAYPLKRLYGSLARLHAKGVVVALDSCFSGAGGRSVLAKGARPLVTKLQDEQGTSSGITLLSASQSDQITGTLDDQGHGIFTYYFLKGLGGAAKDKAGAVTAKGLFEYLKPNVEDEAHRQNREQTPNFSGGDLNIANFK